MGVDRSEYVMVGVSVEKLPFDKWEDKYERYICGFPDESLEVIGISECTGKGGYVIGRVIVRGDSDVGIEKVDIGPELTIALTNHASLVSEIKEKLGMDVELEDIKCYAFTSWS